MIKRQHVRYFSMFVIIWGLSCLTAFTFAFLFFFSEVLYLYDGSSHTLFHLFQHNVKCEIVESTVKSTHTSSSPYSYCDGSCFTCLGFSLWSAGIHLSETPNQLTDFVLYIKWSNSCSKCLLSVVSPLTDNHTDIFR